MRSSILDILEGVRGGRIESADITDRVNARVRAYSIGLPGRDRMKKGIVPEKLALVQVCREAGPSGVQREGRHGYHARDRPDECL